MTAYIPVILFAVLIGVAIGFYLSGGGDSYDVPVPVLLDVKPHAFIPVPDITLTMPVNAVNNISLIRTTLIPIDNKPDKVIFR